MFSRSHASSSSTSRFQPRLFDSIVVFLLLLIGANSLYAAPQPAAHADSAWLLALEGAVGPASADYLVRAIEAAPEAGVPLLVLRIDTPGGLDQSMRVIVRAILESEVPVACLVGPAGARAASAGTFILYACHVAAMVPASNLGAASPVAIGGAPAPQRPAPPDQSAAPPDQSAAPPDASAAPPDSGEEEAAEGGNPASQQGSASERKAMNDAAAYIRSLAAWHGRNAQWAERAVREAATLTAAEALEQQVIDLVVASPAALLREIDGRTVKVGEGRREVILQTAALKLVPVEPDWRQRFLAVITDPNVAYILMMVGIYGLLLEFYSPGTLVPGVLGGISLLLALYAFQVLPISYAALGLVLLGVALMVAEAAAPSFGILGMGGLGAFVMGSILLFDRDVPGMQLALPVVLAFAAVTLGLVIAVLGAALRMRKRTPVGTVDRWVGQQAIVAEEFETEGLVRLHGELWRARTSVPLQAGQQVVVTAVDEFVLAVVPITTEGETVANHGSNTVP